VRKSKFLPVVCELGLLHDVPSCSPSNQRALETASARRRCASKQGVEEVGILQGREKSGGTQKSTASTHRKRRFHVLDRSEARNPNTRFWGRCQVLSSLRLQEGCSVASTQACLLFRCGCDGSHHAQSLWLNDEHVRFRLGRPREHLVVC
jgi:hypothetical protein